jgi:hypothetical protein
MPYSLSIDASFFKFIQNCLERPRMATIDPHVSGEVNVVIALCIDNFFVF